MSRDIVAKTYTYSSILTILVDMKLLKGTKLSNKINQYLYQYPQLVQTIIQLTSFLVVNTNIQQRIYCIINNITKQPYCQHCGTALSMRKSGVNRNTFGKFCSNVCSAKHNDTKQKRSITNIDRYGVDNLLKLSTIRYHKGV